MSHLLEILCVFAMTAYIRVGEFFYERNNLEKKGLLPQLNVFCIEGVG